MSQQECGGFVPQKRGDGFSMDEEEVSCRGEKMVFNAGEELISSKLCRLCPAGVRRCNLTGVRRWFSWHVVSRYPGRLGGNAQ